MAEIATASRDDALDLVQDAMLALVRRYRHRPPEQWPPLFYRILSNRIRDWQRRRRVRDRLRTWLGGRPACDEPSPAQRCDPMDRFPADARSNPADALAERRALAALEAALRELPARQREAFLLRAWEGLDVAATARALGCSAGSVKTHYWRAVHALRRRLEGECGS